MKRTRGTRRLLGGLLALAALGGCKQQLFLEPGDYKDAIQNVNLAKLETQPHDTTKPVTALSGQAPATILDPSRPPRPLTLKEAIAIALEQGAEGGSVNGSGQPGEQLPRSGERGGSSGTDAVRAFALNPAIAAAEIERSLSKFDARWISSMTWNKVDQPTLSLQQSFSNGDRASLSTTLAKPLPTGGVAGITFSTDYLSLATPPPDPRFVTLPTSYTPRLQFVFEQPLLQGFGVEINQLMSSHPGSFLIPGLRPSGGQGTEGILLTRVRSAQSQAEFCRVVNNTLLNVESAYWNLYGAYYNLAAQEEGLKQSMDLYLYIRARVRIGQDRPEQEFLFQAQVELFRAQVLQARGEVLTRERNLRAFLGMRSDDGSRLVPVDEPSVVPFRPEYSALASEALQNRPELEIARQEVKARQLDLLTQRNLRRPDLRLLTNYDIAGLGARLDGDGTQNAFRHFIDNNFNSWQVGLRLDMPIGFRDANALTRQAQLNLWRTYYHLTDAERKTLEYLTEQYRQVLQSYELFKARRAQREALEKVAELQDTRRKAGAFTGQDIANIIQAQRDLSAAIATEFQALAVYNASLAALEYAKGTIQQYNNVTLTEGPLPAYVQKKAADHFRAREAALKLREHPADMPLPGLYSYEPLSDAALYANPSTPSDSTTPGTALPSFPTSVAPSTPAAMPGLPAAMPSTPAAMPGPPAREASPQPRPASTGTGVVRTLPARSPYPPPAVTEISNGVPTFTQTGTVKLPQRPSVPATATPVTAPRPQLVPADVPTSVPNVNYTPAVSR